MDKKKVISEIQSYLANELLELANSAERLKPTDSQKLPKMGARMEEVQQLLTMYKFLPVRDYTDEDVICPGSLVELQFNQTRAYYLLVPKGGGLVTRVEGNAVQVITPQSPLGEGLLGKRVGEELRVQIGGQLRSYTVLALL